MKTEVLNIQVSKDDLTYRLVDQTIVIFYKHVRINFSHKIESNDFYEMINIFNHFLEQHESILQSMKGGNQSERVY